MVSYPTGELETFWLPYLVLMDKFELFIPWRLENGVSARVRAAGALPYFE